MHFPQHFFLLCLKNIYTLHMIDVNLTLNHFLFLKCVELSRWITKVQ